MNYITNTLAPMPLTPEEFPPVMSRSEATAYINLHGYSLGPTTLAIIASTNRGPKYRRAGVVSLYNKSDIDEWLKYPDYKQRNRRDLDFLKKVI